MKYTDEEKEYYAISEDKPKHIKEDPEIVRIKKMRKALHKMLDERSLEDLLKLTIDVAAEKSVNLKRQAQELIDTADTMSRRIGRKDIN